jgi:hypothetical protein
MGRIALLVGTAALILASHASSQEPVPVRGSQGLTPVVPDTTGYVCPMHPDIMSGEPSKCPRCGMDLVPGDPLMASDFRLTVKTTPRIVKAGVPVKFTFTATHPMTGEQVRTFELVHDKLYHLFVLSRDLEFFQHLHPEPEKDGSFSLETTLPQPGHYVLFSDFFPKGGGSQVITTPIVTAGFDGDVTSSIPTLAPESVWDKTVDGSRVQMKVEPSVLLAGEDLDVPVHFTDAATGAAVNDLQRYLGAFAHALILSEDMIDFIHTHPEEQLEGTNITGGGGPDVVFHALFPRPGRYRMWLQFQRHDKLSTAVFTFRVSRLGEQTPTP